MKSQAPVSAAMVATGDGAPLGSETRHSTGDETTLGSETQHSNSSRASLHDDSSPGPTHSQHSNQPGDSVNCDSHQQSTLQSHEMEFHSKVPFRREKTYRLLWRTIGGCVTLIVILLLGIAILHFQSSTRSRHHDAIATGTNGTMLESTVSSPAATSSDASNNTFPSAPTSLSPSFLSASVPSIAPLTNFPPTIDDHSMSLSSTIRLNLVGVAHLLNDTGNATLTYACHVALYGVDVVAPSSYDDWSVDSCRLTHQEVIVASPSPSHSRRQQSRNTKANSVRRRHVRRDLNAARPFNTTWSTVTSPSSSLQVSLLATFTATKSGSTKSSLGDTTVSDDLIWNTTSTNENNTANFLNTLTVRLKASRADTSFRSLVSILVVNEAGVDASSNNAILFNCTVNRKVVLNRTAFITRPSQSGTAAVP